MGENVLKKAMTLFFSAMLVISMAVPAMAANHGSNQPYDDNWPTTKIAHDDVQEVSTDIATFLVSKSLTVNQDNKFPKVENFEFNLTPIGGFRNDNVDTTKSGVTLAANEIPMPESAPTSETADQTSGDPAAHGNENIVLDGGSATIYVGGFNNGTQNQRYYTNYTSKTQTGDKLNDVTSDSAAATNTQNGIRQQGTVSETNSSKIRKRITPVNIKYTKAGYYLYKINEVNSEAYDTVPGMFYDDHTYYLAVYVANKTDARGNTIDGVYVHDVTAWRNDSDTDFKPNLTDIAKIEDIFEANGAGKDAKLQDNTRGKTQEQYSSNPKAQTSGNSTVEANTPGQDDADTRNTNDTIANANPAEVSSNEGNLSKVEKGTNVLPPDFWNDQFTRDIIISKDVVGNLGDRTKEFEYVVELEGLEKNHTYTTNVPAYTTEGAANNGIVDNSNHTATANYAAATLRSTSAGADMYAIPANTSYKVGPDANITKSGIGSVTSAKDTAASESNKVFKTDANGKATFLVKLKDDERLVINSLPVTAKYTVTEVASDHVASLQMYAYKVSKTSGGNAAGKVQDDNGDTTQDVPYEPIFATGDPLTGANATAASGAARHNGTVIKTVDQTGCATLQETVDMTDGTVEMAYTNKRDMATVTGLGGAFYPLVVSAIVLLAALFVFSRRRGSSGLDEL